MDYFGKLAAVLKARWKRILSGLQVYFKKLLFPLYLFPVKFITYTFYYLIIFGFRLVIAVFGLGVDCIVYPFRSLKNFLKSLVILIVVLYLFASLFVIGDYLTKQYGWWGKFLCSFGTRDMLQASVVRIVGGYSEGSGFFISDNQVMTNFHVVADEPSPKIIFPDGKFVTPVKIVGDKNADLAILITEKHYPQFVMPLPDRIILNSEEILLSAGYPLGTDITGKATVLKGRFIDFRNSRRMPVAYAQTDINVVEGMSGGPLVDNCGSVVGINTMGLSGISLFITADWAKTLIPKFTDQEISKINVDPSKSPEEAVRAFYTYLKARRMEDGFKLLSREYLKKTNFAEWTNRFTDILDVTILKSEKYENTPDTAFVKFITKNWVDNESEFHFYEGTWKTIKEDGVYKMLKSKIMEVDNTNLDWMYE